MKKYRWIFVIIQCILFVFVVVFMNDEVKAMTSDKISSVCLGLMLVILLLSISLDRKGKVKKEESSMKRSVRMVLVILCGAVFAGSIVAIVCALGIWG